MENSFHTIDRLKSLLIYPKESKNTEIKGWLDLQNNQHHKEILVKAVLAVANTGGGHIIIGLTEINGKMECAPNMPANLSQYSQDIINNILAGYSNPSLHCEVFHISNPSGLIYPIINVPGGHCIPIMTKRAATTDKLFNTNDIFIRRAGPASEKPQNHQDWLELVERCIFARKDILLNEIRNLLMPLTFPTINPISSKESGLNLWIEESLNRWKKLTADLPQDDIRRFPFGYYWIAYEIQGEKKALENSEFVKILEQSVPHHTGWPPFWLPTKPSIKYYIQDANIECWIGRDKNRQYDNPAHCDFWRISPEGKAFLIRGFVEDSEEILGNSNKEKGKIFDITLPIWRIGESLIHLHNFAKKITVDPPKKAFLKIFYTGLEERQLVDLNKKVFLQEYICNQNQFVFQEAIHDVDNILINLSSFVHFLLKPLYELFDFYELPFSLVEHELIKLKNHKF